MKINDGISKFLKKFNIVDLCIIVFVAVAVIFATIFLKNITNTQNQSQNNFVITLEAKEVKESVCNAVEKDKTVYDKVNNKAIGTLVDYSFKESEKYNVSEEDGKVKNVSVPDSYDLLIEIELNTRDDIYVGKFLSIKTKDFTAAGNVIKVGKVED